MPLKFSMAGLSVLNSQSGKKEMREGLLSTLFTYHRIAFRVKNTFEIDRL